MFCDTEGVAETTRLVEQEENDIANQPYIVQSKTRNTYLDIAKGLTLTTETHQDKTSELLKVCKKEKNTTAITSS